ncbi:hypothetical protein O181_091170 [Austropuccinia psidii MF-1]|uniref:Uncharacterized protein n=1 Tax=Austropuccinia psidii MF-1 TaxID=1389203 RepID=A0A9Q3IX79_9BASI|nr:hypothetical protein [Austropuccinia psidii MF-1]
MIKCPTHSPVTASKMSNCAIITLEREPSLMHPPTRAHAHAYAQTPAPADAHANAPPHAHANATAPHPRYCVAGSTSVICKMTIPPRRSPLMDDLVRSNPPLYIKTG